MDYFGEYIGNRYMDKMQRRYLGEYIHRFCNPDGAHLHCLLCTTMQVTPSLVNMNIAIDEDIDVDIDEDIDVDMQIRQVCFPICTLASAESALQFKSNRILLLCRPA